MAVRPYMIFDVWHSLRELVLRIDINKFKEYGFAIARVDFSFASLYSLTKKGSYTEGRYESEKDLSIKT